MWSDGCGDRGDEDPVLRGQHLSRGGDLGFPAVLVEDGHTCSDTPGLSAEAIVAHHNGTLVGAFCQVVTAREYQF